MNIYDDLIKNKQVKGEWQSPEQRTWQGPLQKEHCAYRHILKLREVPTTQLSVGPACTALLGVAKGLGPDRTPITLSLLAPYRPPVALVLAFYLPTLTLSPSDPCSRRASRGQQPQQQQHIPARALASSERRAGTA